MAETYQDEDKIVMVAMEIIVEAGDARLEANKALEAVETFEFEKAKEHIAAAREHIRKAHNAQTETIQAEIAGTEAFPSPLLFNHAQDTIMTIITEVNLSEKILKLFEIFYREMKG